MRSLLSRLPVWIAGPVPISLSLLAASALLIWAGSSIGIRWDPFGFDRRRLEAAQSRAIHAERDAAARQAEVAGERDQARRLEHTLKPVRDVEALTSTAIHKARTADEAQIPLAPDRADRLRDHDRELCRLAPDLAGCAATTGAS